MTYPKSDPKFIMDQSWQQWAASALAGSSIRPQSRAAGFIESELFIPACVPEALRRAGAGVLFT